MRLPSFSSLGRAMKCPGSVVLEHVTEPTNTAAERGTEIHAFIERFVKGATVEESLAQVPDAFRDICSRVNLSVIPAGSQSELAVGFDSHKKETVVYRLPKARAYPEDGLWHGTLDLVGILDGQTAWLADVKTGVDPEPPEESWQIRAQAVAARYFSGKPNVVADVLHLKPNGTWSIMRARWDEFDLSGFADEMEDLRLRISKLTVASPGDLTIGGHCDWCPAARICPAHTALAKSIIGLATVEEKLREMTWGEVGQVWQKVEIAEDVIKRVKASMKALVAQAGEVALPDGRKLRLFKQERRGLDPRAAAHLVAMFPIERLLPAADFSVGKLEDEIVEALDAEGLVTRTVIEYPRAFKK